MIIRNLNNVTGHLRSCHNLLQKAACSKLTDTTKKTEKATKRTLCQEELKNETRNTFQNVATELFKCLKTVKDLKEIAENFPRAQKQLDDLTHNPQRLPPEKIDTTTFSSKEEYFKALKAIKEVERLLKK